MNIGKTLDWNGIFATILPLYVAIGLAFASVRWWKIFTLEQCTGINRYVAEFAIPFLLLDMLMSTNVYTMNFQVIAADALQKTFILVVLFLLKWLRKDFSLEWVVTLFSISAFTNNLIIGVPLIGSMYGEGATTIVIQILVFQCAIWFNVMIAMYEYTSARQLVKDHFHETHSSDVSLKIEHGISLSGGEPLQTCDEGGANGKLNMVVRTSSKHEIKPSSFVKEVFSLQSSKGEITTRNSSSISVSDPDNLGQLSTNNIIAHESFDVDVQIGPSEPSLQQEITSNRYVIEYSSSSTLPLMFKPFDNLVLAKGLFLSHSNLFSFSSSPTKSLDKGDGVVKEKVLGEGVLIKLILISLWRKFIKNSVTYATIVGIVWSLITFRFNFKTPLIIKGIVELISKTGTGMAMFSLGLSIALQPKFMTSKVSITVMSTVVRFLVGPATMAAASAVVGLKGVIFQVATIQAALPTLIICFVFAKQYNIHPEILSTSIVISTVIYLPVTIIYFMILQHYS